MTMINWAEVQQLTRLDEFIAYAIITLEEAYTAPNNEDLDSVTKKDVSEWIRWEIAYDEQGRAFFRYGASLYVADRHPLGDTDFLDLIYSPTMWLVNHSSVSIDLRTGDTSLQIDPLVDIPISVDSMEKLLFWAVVLGDWWNRTLRYIGETLAPIMPLPAEIPIGNWGSYVVSPGTIISTVDTGSIDAQFDAYNGLTDSDIPDFLKGILDESSSGTGIINQNIDLSASDSEPYRENLVTCEEQDPAIKNYSRQQLETLLPKK